MMTASSSVANPATLLERAALMRAIALGFAYPAPGHGARVREALKQARSSAGNGAWARRLARALNAARRAWRAAEEDQLRTAFAWLFLGNPACPPHETAYGDGRRIAGRTAELADIAAFYGAFGLELSRAQPDLPDHLCAEIECYSILLVKQAYADSRKARAQSRIASAAARAFLEDHLGRWIGAFAEGLRERYAPQAYRALAALLVAAVQAECRRQRVRPTRFMTRLPSDEMQADAFACPLEHAVPARP